MTDLDIAVLVIKAASVARADYGCDSCSMQVLEEAMRLRPHLPWDLAAKGLAEENEFDFGFALRTESVGHAG